MMENVIIAIGNNVDFAGYYDRADVHSNRIPYSSSIEFYIRVQNPIGQAL